MTLTTPSHKSHPNDHFPLKELTKNNADAFGQLPAEFDHHHGYIQFGQRIILRASQGDVQSKVMFRVSNSSKIARELLQNRATKCVRSVANELGREQSIV
jgi:hypothetical protein